MTKVITTKNYRAVIFSLVSFGIAVATSGAATPTEQDKDFLPNIIEKIQPGVVNISSTTVVTQNAFGMEEFLRFWGVPQQQKRSTLGSGFIIDSQGYLLTNNHVVDQAKEVLITLLDNRNFRARVVGKDPKLDVAILQIKDEKGKVPSKITPVGMGDSSKVRIGETVLAIGNPFGLAHTVTKGIISAKHRTIGVGPFDNFLQTDASINPGNSGGPLFDLNGKVIGINTVIYSRVGQSSGLGFAIPINEALAILPDLKKYGRVPRPWLGILGEKITPQLRYYYQLKLAEGVLVYNLVEGGPADQAGIRQGDIITQLLGKSISDVQEVERLLSKKSPGDTIAMQIVRNGKKKRIKIKLKEHPGYRAQLPSGII